MPGIDTNVLVRWLVDDEPRQSARVAALFDAARAEQLPLFVPNTVMLELEWVLRSRYRFDRPAVLRALGALLETQELEFEVEAAVERALHLYRLGAAEFADCLHAGICGAAQRSPLLTFDRLASKMPGVQRLQA
jgi:predicted nucleic-acid-binding protein